MSEAHSHDDSVADVRVSPDTTPDAMRAAMNDYVSALHAAYLDQASKLTPGERAELPLVKAGQFTVVAVGTRHLHVVGTTSPLPAPAGPEVELVGSDRDLAWTLRFFDPVLLPELGILDESAGPDALGVRRALGITDVVYHLSVAPGGGLSPHHAQHAGTGLANAHSASARDYDALRAYAPSRVDIIDEFAATQRLGLTTASRLLASLLAPRDPLVESAADPAALRRALIEALRPPAGVR